MNHKIKKSDLKLIFDSVCEGWQKKLTNILLWSEGKEVEISDELLQQGYKEANADQKKLIEKYFKIEKPQDICEKIQTWADVLKINQIKTYKDLIPNAKSKEEKSINAFNKFLLVCKAYNGGWEADIKNTSQNKYYIYRYFSGGVLCFVVYCGYYYAYFSLGLHLKEEKYAKDIIKKFPEILTDYFMI